MKIQKTFSTTVRVDGFFSQEYGVSATYDGTQWSFTDPWTGYGTEADTLDQLLTLVKGARSSKRSDVMDRVARAVRESTGDWPVQPGCTARYDGPDGKTIALVVCVRKDVYTVQLFGLPAFLSAPIPVKGKEQLLLILHAARLDLYTPTNDVAPELEQAFKEFDTEVN